jgi:hypothetical protein
MRREWNRWWCEAGVMLRAAAVPGGLYEWERVFFGFVVVTTKYFAFPSELVISIAVLWFI